MTTHVFEQGLMQMANRLASTVSGATGVNITEQESQDILAEVIFNASLGDTRPTYLADSKTTQPVNVNTSQVSPSYFLVHYGSDMHLFKGFQLLKSNIAGSDSWVTPGDFSLDAYELAQSDNESDLHFECLPQILGQSWNDDGIAALARSLGMLKTHFSVFQSVGSAILVRINGRPSYSELNPDYLSHIELAYEAAQDPFDVLVWEPETEDGDTFHFTLGDMAKAIMVYDGEVWRIPSKWGEVEVAVFR